MPGSSSKTKEAAKATRERPTSKQIAFWERYYQKRQEQPERFLETIILLERSGKMQDVEAALLGYLKTAKFRMPWMYEMLAVALEHNMAPEESVKQTLVYAAVLARKADPEGDPESLVTIVDMMAMRKWFSLSIPDGKGGTLDVKVGDLLDEARRRLPHKPEPLLRSVDLALLEKDPDRMGMAVEGLMELGWPEVDAEWRSEARKYAERLARILREEGKTGEADELMARVDAAEPRDVFARLSWDGGDGADLDLEVDEPLGATCAIATPRTVFGGAIVQNGRGKDREEIYVCPRGFDGKYVFRVKTIVDDPEAPVSNVRLEVITHEGASEQSIQSFEIDPSKPSSIEVVLSGGRRKEVLPFVMPKVLGVKARVNEARSAAPRPAREVPAAGPGREP